MKKFIVGLTAIACLATITATDAEARRRHKKACNTQVTVPIAVPSPEGYQVTFELEKVESKVRHGVVASVNNPWGSRKLEAGTHVLKGNIHFRMKCERRRKLYVLGLCKVIKDGKVVRRTKDYASSGLQRTKGDHNFGTISVCTDAKP